MYVPYTFTKILNKKFDYYCYYYYFRIALSY
jgi:hypothetical protein